MVYHPYFRGKQFELVAIRETAELLSSSKFTPIVEPVKEQLQVLRKSLDAVVEAKGSAILIVNPQIGDHSAGQTKLFELIDNGYPATAGIMPGMLLTESSGLDDVTAFCGHYGGREVCLVHSGFGDGKGLAGLDLKTVAKHVFVESHSGKLYQKHLASAGSKVLLRDGFTYRAANRDYPDNEFFSDLHLTYQLEGMQAFGDYLMVGNRFVEGGGPAYAIAIHLTYIDPDKEDAMYIYHFKSDSQTTPKNPAGKFAEAVAKLVGAADAPNSKLFPSTAIGEFREFHKSGHYPGLGYVKKLAMKHHIETLAHYLG